MLAASSFSFISCENRDNAIENLNEGPSLAFLNTDEEVFRDTVKLSLKSAKTESEFTVSYFDENGNVESIVFKIKQGSGIMAYKNNPQHAIQNQNLSFSGGTIDLIFKPDQIGTHKLSFTGTDAFGETAVASAEIYAFTNWNPVASFKLNNTQVLSPYEREIDASESYDADGKFGGGIQMYRYFVNNKLISTESSPKLKYIFPEPGNYTIRVDVVDTDGAENSISNVYSIN